MLLDRKLTGILREIQQEIELKHGIVLTIDKLKEIVESQAKGIVKGMINRIAVKVDYLGKFIIKDGREAALNANKDFPEEMPKKERKGLLRKVVFATTYNGKKAQIKVNETI